MHREIEPLREIKIERERGEKQRETERDRESKDGVGGGR